MEDIVHSATDLDASNQLDGEVWDLEDIVDPAEESSRAMSEALDDLGVKCRSAGITVPDSPAEVISLESAGLDLRESSSTAELACMRNRLDTYRSNDVSLETDMADFPRDFSELASSKTAPEVKLEVAEARLK